MPRANTGPGAKAKGEGRVRVAKDEKGVMVEDEE